MRLDKFLSDNNLGTRTEIKKALKKGACEINGEVIKQSDYKINEEDIIVYLGRVIKNKGNKNIYIMLNKPKDVVSATRDNLHKTVIDILGDGGRKDLFPVGRLDKDTTGLLIITNDGEFAHNTLSPKKHVPKKYYVELDGELDKKMVKLFEDGIRLNEDEVCKSAKLEILNSNNCYLTIIEGKFHQIKRMFIKLGLEVVELKRVSFGGLVLDETLGLGEFRELSEKEIKDVVK